MCLIPSPSEKVPLAAGGSGWRESQPDTAWRGSTLEGSIRSLPSETEEPQGVKTVGVTGNGGYKENMTHRIS